MKTREDAKKDNVVPLLRNTCVDAGQVCAQILAHHEEQLALCQKLEEIADELPEISDTQMCLSLARKIQPMVRAAHEHEERTVFPILMASDGIDSNLKASLERLRYEHWEDESYADEVSDALSRFVTDKASVNVETLAYMLRGFFEGLRRHIAFEREHIVPLLCQKQVSK
ncbi:hemerythrin domain-containing protein [Oricola thermophila]|uniref:Hemerythrin domain-containing protein n=1 Tax=Oricola thermophila TaxID=2742145 RepID=A0A6N1VE48_9HYPH|nr:hemerythrin domain-containing protein [Oricola thermophila]QKV17492.1 hemerythrin domain-containing protein [Oricola thermophila]